MGEILISATVLILIIMILRSVTKGKISMRFRYALWLVVALRLMIPVSFGSSSFSVMNLALKGLDYTGRMAETVWTQRQVEACKDGGTGEAGEAAEGGMNAAGSVGMTDEHRQILNGGNAYPYVSDPGTAVLPDGNTGKQNLPGYNLMVMTVIRFRLMVIWGIGMLVTGGYLLICHIRFVRFLRRMRREVPAAKLPEAWSRRIEVWRMHIYVVKGLPSPCLVGRDIYMEPQMLQGKNKLRHILAHEYMHARQGDAFWAFLRSMLCAVYWFYPLAWVAAYASKKDSELACDEGVIRLLGEAERFAYGRTLLDLLSKQPERCGYEGVVWIMGGRKSHVRERVSVIAGKGTRSKAVAFFAAAVMFLGGGCAFGGAEAEDIPAGRNTGEFIMTNSAGAADSNAGVTRELNEGGQADREQQDAAFGENEEEGQSTKHRAQEEYERDAADVAAFGEEQQIFEQLLYSMDDGGLASAANVDLDEYADYLYEGADCPMEDGKWYVLPQLHADETGIEFYGLYTEKYGCRGMKIRIGDDVNTFDQPWQPVSDRMSVVILEASEEDGMPGSFAFNMCVANSSSSEIWRLYVADRYDTGTIELFSFTEDDYRKQRDTQKMSIRVGQAEEKADLVDEADAVIDTVDISRYAKEDVKEAVWDDGTVGFSLEEEGESRIALITGIGLKESGSDKIFYQGLPLISFPVEIGNFGERKFTLGRPYVSRQYISGKLNR